MKITEQKECRRFKIEGLKERRKELGVEQKVLARYLQLSPQYLCDIENGRRFISEKQALAIMYAEIDKILASGNKTEAVK